MNRTEKNRLVIMPLPNDEHRPNYYLKPGELCCTDHPAWVTTVLGSCVSVTCFHRSKGLAAICHVLHPECPRQRQCTDGCSAMNRFAPCAIGAIARWMSAHQARPGEIEVKLFGGAAMMGQHAHPTLHLSVGQLNVQAALKTLQHLGLSLKMADAGGTAGRKILFDTATGAVWLKRLSPGTPHRPRAI